MPRTPTLKQKKFVKEYLKSGNKRQSAKIAYQTDSNEYADRLSKMNSHSKIVRAYMQKLLDQHGMSDEKIAETLTLLREAGTTPKALKRATPELALKAIQEAIKLKDLYPAEKKEIKQQTMRMDLDNKDTKDLIDILKKQQREVSQFNKMIDKENVQ